MKYRCVTITHVDWSKDESAFWFSQDELVKRYLVAEELHDDTIDRHHHIFVEYSEDVNLDYVRSCVTCLSDNLSIDVSVCKSQKNWLKYCTKYDFNPVRFNVRVEELSFGAQLSSHVEDHYISRYQVDFMDPFLVMHGNNRSTIISYINEWLSRRRVEIVDQREVILPNVSCGFTMRFDYWFGENKGNIYLWGEPGVGKTELVDFYMKGERVWRPSSVSPYMWSGLTEDFEYVWFEDFRISNYRTEISRLLSLMDGKPVSVQGKYKDDQLVLTRARFIFTSNEKDDIDYPEFARRVQIFHVDHQMFCCPGGAGCGGGDVTVSNPSISTQQRIMNRENQG
ncbi:unnamed protein product [Didymodactylos carnosus]|uniref:Helicase superfamily 3 single-stranded DNA/RNA virus domain-containing protein n=1 Tax=Didymodactylos carnosus TaxID=1234261 RepID=A0A814QLT0_9BILA|nr:unnamed protein product [Didymodactylos carnosus]CAF1121482.1 unnamed protein product [Didymodactylos carnosus]CAF3653675.1 unnamed protein product [Didymodactylos carnosus]CAF3885007.1 unnamed protein product [Didymodactylos carnosus]